jgi:AcrR family transcriptional regulator
MANDTPRTKEKEVRTAEIEQAARKVFLSRGFQAATIQEIAEEAGIAKGTVYLYYKSKDDLYAALLLPSLEFLNETFAPYCTSWRARVCERGGAVPYARQRHRAAGAGRGDDAPAGARRPGEQRSDPSGCGPRRLDTRLRSCAYD